MQTKQMMTTAGSILCLLDDQGSIIGWIPYPLRRDALGPGRETVYLARALAVADAAASRAA